MGGLGAGPIDYKKKIIKILPLGMVLIVDPNDRWVALNQVAYFCSC